MSKRLFKSLQKLNLFWENTGQELNKELRMDSIRESLNSSVSSIRHMPMSTTSVLDDDHQDNNTELTINVFGHGSINTGSSRPPVCMLLVHCKYCCQSGITLVQSRSTTPQSVIKSFKHGPGRMFAALFHTHHAKTSTRGTTIQCFGSLANCPGCRGGAGADDYVSTPRVTLGNVRGKQFIHSGWSG